jgi:hypothetical protein
VVFDVVVYVLIVDHYFILQKWITEKTADKFQDDYVKEIKEVSHTGYVAWWQNLIYVI